jgi:hypothetical protein
MCLGCCFDLLANLTHAWNICIKVNLFEIKPSHCIYWNDSHCLLVFSSFDMFCKFCVLWKNVQLCNPKCHCNKLYFACMWCLICWCNCSKLFDLLSSHNANYCFLCLKYGWYFAIIYNHKIQIHQSSLWASFNTLSTFESLNKGCLWMFSSMDICFVNGKCKGWVSFISNGYQRLKLKVQNENECHDFVCTSYSAF